MAHTIREKTKLLNRVRRIRGQVEALERALESELGCADVLQLIASVRGAVNGLMGEVMEDHIRLHVVDPRRERDPKRARGAGVVPLDPIPIGKGGLGGSSARQGNPPLGFARFAPAHHSQPVPHARGRRPPGSDADLPARSLASLDLGRNSS